MAGGKYRSFLVHIKAVSDSSMEESPRPVLRMPSAKPQSSKAHTLSSLLQQSQASKVGRLFGPLAKLRQFWSLVDFTRAALSLL